MKDALENLKAFYDQCDRAEAPVQLTLASRMISRATSIMVGGVAPFVIAFSLAAVMMSMAGAAAQQNAPQSPVVFPNMLRSAGLSKADVRVPAPRNESHNSSATWRA